MIEFKYIEEVDELLAELGMTDKEVWDYMSLDDWDYALVFTGHIPPKKLPTHLLVGCSSNEWQYIPKIKKTVGIAYHA